jgi:hypothetical protein
LFPAEFKLRRGGSSARTLALRRRFIAATESKVSANPDLAAEIMNRHLIIMNQEFNRRPQG